MQERDIPQPEQNRQLLSLKEVLQAGQIVPAVCAKLPEETNFPVSSLGLYWEAPTPGPERTGRMLLDVTIGMKPHFFHQLRKNDVNLGDVDKKDPNQSLDRRGYLSCRLGRCRDMPLGFYTKYQIFSRRGTFFEFLCFPFLLFAFLFMFFFFDILYWCRVDREEIFSFLSIFFIFFSHILCKKCELFPSLIRSFFFNFFLFLGPFFVISLWKRIEKERKRRTRRKMRKKKTTFYLLFPFFFNFFLFLGPFSIISLRKRMDTRGGSTHSSCYYFSCSSCYGYFIYCSNHSKKSFWVFNVA